MKITSFNPQIITKDAGSLVQLFESLGFEKRHDQAGIGELKVEGIRMKDANGFYVDISQPEMLPPRQDMATIRMNVDDFEAAYSLLISRGFRNFYRDHTADTRTSRSAMMISPSGFAINLIQHIKK